MRCGVIGARASMSPRKVKSRNVPLALVALAGDNRRGAGRSRGPVPSYYQHEIRVETMPPEPCDRPAAQMPSCTPTWVPSRASLGAVPAGSARSSRSAASD